MRGGRRQKGLSFELNEHSLHIVARDLPAPNGGRFRGEPAGPEDDAFVLGTIGLTKFLASLALRTTLPTSGVKWLPLAPPTFAWRTGDTFGEAAYLFKNETCASCFAAFLDELEILMPGGRVGVACFFFCRNLKSRDGTASALVGSGTIFPPHASHSFWERWRKEEGEGERGRAGERSHVSCMSVGPSYARSLEILTASQSAIGS